VRVLATAQGTARVPGAGWQVTEHPECLSLPHFLFPDSWFLEVSPSEGDSSRNQNSGIRCAPYFQHSLHPVRALLSTLLVVLTIVLVLCLALVALVWWQQERVVFQPPRQPSPAPPSWARRVSYQASDGQPLFGYLVGGKSTSSSRTDAAATPLLLAFHGNADLAIWRLDWAREVARRTGARVLVAEYRGYGGLAGTPNYAGSRLDALAAFEFLRDSLGARAAGLTIYGQSLGSAVATELAEQLARRDEPPRALVLESPFTSAEAMARIALARPIGWLWKAIARVHYDSRRIVASYDVPVWVAHGERDRVVPTRMGRELYAAARRKGELLLVPGAGHNDVELVAREDYWRWLGRAVVGGGAPAITTTGR